MNINTIFYFVGTKVEYEQKWQNGDINARTIVFITDTGEIYKNGVRYGGLTRNEVINESTTVVNNNEYDDTEIRNSINRLLGLIDGLNDDIDALISDKENDIIDIINNVLSEYTWLKKNLGDVFHLSAWVSELESYLTTNGYLTDNGGTWTTLLQTVNSITGRVNLLEGNQLTEAQIKTWINNGVAGIDLSTYALKSELGDFITMGDISDFITMDDLRNNFESLLTVSTAFLSLRSDIDNASAAIGAWGRTHNNDTITDLFGALLIQVDNLEDSVTTSLSSTVRQYLNDDLANGVGDYLENQAGLILTSNLDSAVAGLFSLTTKTSTESAVEGVTNRIVNTAGFMTESDLDGAMATIFALSDNGGEYDSSETYFWFDEGSLANVAHLYVDADVLTVNAEHTLTEMVGHVYDSYDQNAVALTALLILDTITMVSESTTPPTVGISYASRLNPSVIIGEITKLSKAEAALHKSKLYAAILVGVKNDQSFIKAVADRVHVDASEIEINASQLALTGDQITISAGHEIVLDGVTWADVLNVDQLLASAATIGGWTIESNKLSSTANSKSIYLDPTGITIFTSSSILQLDPTYGLILAKQSGLGGFALGHYTPTATIVDQFAMDGSGKIANGSITWDTSGNVTFAPGAVTSMLSSVGDGSGIDISSGLINIYSPSGDGLTDGGITISGESGANSLYIFVRDASDGDGDYNYIKITPYDILVYHDEFVTAKLEDDKLTIWDQGHDIYCDLLYDGLYLGDNNQNYIRTKYNSNSDTHANLCIFGDEDIYLENDVYVKDYSGSTYFNVYASAFNQQSDERLKNKIEDIELPVETIAEAPAIKYTFKADKDAKVKAGSIAQYWLNVLPEVVNEDRDGCLSLDYASTSLVSTISLAKEIVKLKETIASLEARIQELETSK